jgi:hypothetical protein
MKFKIKRSEEMEFELTKQNEIVLITSLIGEFLHCLKEKNKEKAISTILKIKSIEIKKNNEAIILQKTFIELVIYILRGETVYYSDLAKKLNEKYAFNIPIKGSSLGKKLGNVLGSLSIISLIHTSVAISVYVVNKQTNKAGEGFKNLLRIMNNNLEKKEDEAYNENVEKYKVNVLFQILKEDNKLNDLIKKIEN